MQTPDREELIITCAPADYDGVQPDLRRLLEQAAHSYHILCPGEPPLRVTSGRRSLREQAETMAAMSPQQLLSLYSGGGCPQYIAAILHLESVTPDAVYRILCERREGYVSRHLGGQAVDIGAAGVTFPGALKKILAEAGAGVKDERACGISCFHLWLPGSTPIIVKE